MVYHRSQLEQHHSGLLQVLLIQHIGDDHCVQAEPLCSELPGLDIGARYLLGGNAVLGLPGDRR